MKSLFEYDNYRNFLSDFYADAKAKDKKFSFRYFARIAGFKSSNFLYLVMKEKSNMSPESTEKLARALKLNKEESEFFRNLVLFNQSATADEKALHSRNLLRSRTFKKIFPLGASQYHYFSTWYYTIVRGLVGLPGFKENPEWIAKQVNPPITPEQAAGALEVLLKLGLIQRSPQGILQQTNSNIASANSVTSSSLAQFHREMMKKASESIDRVPREKRDLSAMTIGVSPETAEKIKEICEKFRSDIVDVASRDRSPNMLYQLNIYWFPMAEIQAPEKKTEKKS